MENINFPPQSSKARRIKRFGENIGYLSFYINVSHLYIFLLNMVSQEVVSAHSFMEDCVFDYRDGTDVVAHKGNSLENHSKVSHGVHNL
jgi:hypothetical protein